MEKNTTKEKRQGARRSPIIGTVGDDGINLKQDKTVAATPPDGKPADFYMNTAVIEHIIQEILGFEDTEDRTATAFIAVLDEIQRLADAGSTVAIEDLCSTLKLAVYQETRTCEAAAWAFAKSAHEGVQHV
jgi:hypothetical protein